MHFDNESAVQKALAHPDHQLAGSQLTVRPRRPITSFAGHRILSEVRSNLQKAKAAVSEQAEAQKKAEHEHLMHILLQEYSVSISCFFFFFSLAWFFAHVRVSRYNMHGYTLSYDLFL